MEYIRISGTGSYKSSLSLLAPPTPLVVKSKDDTDSNEGTQGLK
jgi:hypothetical protein